MDYQFRKSKTREVQEWIVGLIRAAIPNETVQVFSRLKGDTENDIEDALSSLGLAIVVSPYLVTEYASLAMSLRAQEGVIAVSVVENVQNNTLQIDGVDVHADNLLDAVTHTLYDELFYGAPLRFQAVEYASPADEPIMTLIQKIGLSIDL